MRRAHSLSELLPDALHELPRLRALEVGHILLADLRQDRARQEKASPHRQVLDGPVVPAGPHILGRNMFRAGGGRAGGYKAIRERMRAQAL